MTEYRYEHLFLFCQFKKKAEVLNILSGSGGEMILLFLLASNGGHLEFYPSINFNVLKHCSLLML